MIVLVLFDVIICQKTNLGILARYQRTLPICSSSRTSAPNVCEGNVIIRPPRRSTPPNKRKYACKLLLTSCLRMASIQINNSGVIIIVVSKLALVV